MGIPPRQRLQAALDADGRLAAVAALVAAVDWCLAVLPEDPPPAPAESYGAVRDLGLALLRLGELDPAIRRLITAADAENLAAPLEATLRARVRAGEELARLRRQRDELATATEHLRSAAEATDTLSAEIAEFQRVGRLAERLPQLRELRDELANELGDTPADLAAVESDLQRIVHGIVTIGTGRLALLPDTREALAEAEALREQIRDAAASLEQTAAQNDNLRHELDNMRAEGRKAAAFFEDLRHSRQALLGPYQEQMADYLALSQALARANRGPAISTRPDLQEVEQTLEDLGRRLNDVDVTLERALAEHEQRYRERHRHFTLNDPAQPAPGQRG